MYKLRENDTIHFVARSLDDAKCNLYRVLYCMLINCGYRGMLINGGYRGMVINGYLLWVQRYAYLWLLMVGTEVMVINGAAQKI